MLNFMKNGHKIIVIIDGGALMGVQGTFEGQLNDSS